LAGGLSRFVQQVAPLFKSKTHSSASETENYLKGLLVAQKANVEVMANELEKDYQDLHHFIHSASWDEKTGMQLLRPELSQAQKGG
jgi:enoyl-[acyl-carrier-protein] reductase (NADH)